MNEKHTLMTYSEIVEKFKDKCSKWNESDGELNFTYMRHHWCINSAMKKMLGKEYEFTVRDTNYYSPYTHSANGWAWHKSWFAPEIVLEEELFEI